METIANPSANGMHINRLTYTIACGRQSLSPARACTPSGCDTSHTPEQGIKHMQFAYFRCQYGVALPLAILYPSPPLFYHMLVLNFMSRAFAISFPKFHKYLFITRYAI